MCGVAGRHGRQPRPGRSLRLRGRLRGRCSSIWCVGLWSVVGHSCRGGCSRSCRIVRCVVDSLAVRLPCLALTRDQQLVLPVFARAVHTARRLAAVFVVGLRFVFVMIRIGLGFPDGRSHSLDGLYSLVGRVAAPEHPLVPAVLAVLDALVVPPALQPLAGLVARAALSFLVVLVAPRALACLLVVLPGRPSLFALSVVVHWSRRCWMRWHPRSTAPAHPPTACASSCRAGRCSTASASLACRSATGVVVVLGLFRGLCLDLDLDHDRTRDSRPSRKPASVSTVCARNVNARRIGLMVGLSAVVVCW